MVVEALLPQATAGVLSEKVAMVQWRRSWTTAKVASCAMVPASSRSELVMEPDGLSVLTKACWTEEGKGTAKHMGGGEEGAEQMATKHHPCPA